MKTPTITDEQKPRITFDPKRRCWRIEFRSFPFKEIWVYQWYTDAPKDKRERLARGTRQGEWKKVWYQWNTNAPPEPSTDEMSVYRYLLMNAKIWTLALERQRLGYKETTA